MGRDPALASGGEGAEEGDRAAVEVGREDGAASTRRATSDTVATLIGLRVSYGLRASEALRLDIDDVDLVGDLPCLQIRRTKFRKSRLGPLHPTTAAALRTYAEQRRAVGYDGLCSVLRIRTRRQTPLPHARPTVPVPGPPARTARVGWPASHPTVKSGHFRAGVHRPFGGTRGRHRHGNRHSRGRRPSTRAPRASACEPYRELIVEAFGADVPRRGVTGRRSSSTCGGRAVSGAGAIPVPGHETDRHDGRQARRSRRGGVSPRRDIRGRDGVRGREAVLVMRLTRDGRGYRDTCWRQTSTGRDSTWRGRSASSLG